MEGAAGSASEVGPGARAESGSKSGLEVRTGTSAGNVVGTRPASDKAEGRGMFCNVGKSEREEGVDDVCV